MPHGLATRPWVVLDLCCTAGEPDFSSTQSDGLVHLLPGHERWLAYEANRTARPRRLAGATPEQVWQARRPLTAEERLAFQTTVAQFRAEERTQRDLPTEGPLRRPEQAAVDRTAFRRALVAHDLLLFRRRRIPPRITRPKLATKG